MRRGEIINRRNGVVRHGEEELLGEGEEDWRGGQSGDSLRLEETEMEWDED